MSSPFKNLANQRLHQTFSLQEIYKELIPLWTISQYISFKDIRNLQKPAELVTHTQIAQKPKLENSG